jgi:hypothetical protein
MKKFILFLALILYLVVLASFASAIPLTITSPENGAQYYKDGIMEVSWNYSDYTDNNWTLTFSGAGDLVVNKALPVFGGAIDKSIFTVNNYVNHVTYDDKIAVITQNDSGSYLSEYYYNGTEILLPTYFDNLTTKGYSTIIRNLADDGFIVTLSQYIIQINDSGAVITPRTTYDFQGSTVYWIDMILSLTNDSYILLGAYSHYSVLFDLDENLTNITNSNATQDAGGGRCHLWWCAQADRVRRWTNGTATGYIGWGGSEFGGVVYWWDSNLAEIANSAGWYGSQCLGNNVGAYDYGGYFYSLHTCTSNYNGMRIYANDVSRPGVINGNVYAWEFPHGWNRGNQNELMGGIDVSGDKLGVLTYYYTDNETDFRLFNKTLGYEIMQKVDDGNTLQSGIDNNIWSLGFSAYDFGSNGQGFGLFSLKPDVSSEFDTIKKQYKNKLLLADLTDLTNYGDYALTISNGIDSSSVNFTLVACMNATGNGSVDNPYQLTTTEQIYAIRSCPDMNFVLGDDINASKTYDWVMTEPQHSYYNPYHNGLLSIPSLNGTLNGQGYSIDGLYMHAIDGTGLFSTIASTGNVSNLILRNMDVSTAASRAGSLTTTNNGIIDGVSLISSKLIGGYGVIGYGMLVGTNNGDIYNSFTINESYSEVTAGFVSTNYGNIYDSSVINPNMFGPAGFVYDNYGLIMRSSVRGGINQISQYRSGAAGFIINNRGTGTVLDSYSTTEVYGGGGLAGFIYSNYPGAVVNNTHFAGIIARTQSWTCYGWGTWTAPISSYWLLDAFPTSDVGIGKTNNQMKKESTFVGWDFEKIWAIDEGIGYPYLQSEVTSSRVSLISPANHSVLERSTGTAELKARIIAKDPSLNVTFYDASNDFILCSAVVNESGSVYCNWTGLIMKNTYFWYVNMSNGVDTMKSDVWQFTPDIEPKPLNMRIDDISKNAISIKWDNQPDMEWISLRIGSDIMEVRGILGVSQEWNVTVLYPNSDYIFEWQLGDNLTSMSDYYNLNFRSGGWKPDWTDYKYKRLVTVNSSTIGSDLDDYAVNVSLTENNFQYFDPVNYVYYPAFKHLNWTSGNDIRVVDYYETTQLPFAVTKWNISGAGCVDQQTIPNAFNYTGTFATYGYAHDGDWLTQATPNPDGVDYYNYTIPVGAKTTSKFRIYDGEWGWDLDIPADCFGGTDLQFKSVANTTPAHSVKTYCRNNSDSNDWILERDNLNASYYIYETLVTWEYSCEADISVIPIHFNDSTQQNVPGIDGNYDTKFWIYYGYSGAENNESVISPAGISQVFALGDEIGYVAQIPVISNVTTSGETATSMNVSWLVDQPVDNRIQIAENPWMLDATWASRIINYTEVFNHIRADTDTVLHLYVRPPYYGGIVSVECSNSTYSANYSINDSKSPVEITFQNVGDLTYYDWTVIYVLNDTIQWNSGVPAFVVDNLDLDTVYYYRLWAYGLGGLNTTYDGSFTLGAPSATPLSEVINYTENRSDHQVIVCGNLTDMNNESSVDCSIQYWNERSIDFNETTADNLTSLGTFCRIVDVDYGYNYGYRTKCVASTTGYSDAYFNEFAPIQEFFAGNPVEDDQMYENRQYCPNGIGVAPCYEQKGYREGSLQQEDWIWIETNIIDQGTLTVHWWNGSSWSTYDMINDTDSNMRYLQLVGLGSAWQTFYVTGSADNTVLNWTKPSMIHLAYQNRTDESKYVAFSGTPEAIDYQLLYMDSQRYNLSAYRWCIAAGGSLYDCMGVEYWGGGKEVGIPARLSGTEYDRGQLFRGGVINGEMYDTGILTETRNFDRSIGDDLYNERHCFAFTDYWWDKSIVPTNNITNYYYHYWTENEKYSDYLGHNQDRLFDWIYLMRFEYDNFSFTRDWKAIDGTTNYNEGVVKSASGSYWNTAADQSLIVGYIDGFNAATDKDQIYNFGFYTDGRWTNQQFGKHQQAFVIFNLPDNATLQSMDSDSDNLTDYDELFVYYTNPKSNDTDEDGRADGYEISQGTDLNLAPNNRSVLIIESYSVNKTDQIIVNVSYHDIDNDSGITYVQWSLDGASVKNETIGGLYDGALMTFLLNSSYFPVGGRITFLAHSVSFGASSDNISRVFNIFNGDGSGIEGDPFQITNCLQLQQTYLNLTAYYDVMNDINCSDTINWNSGSGFVPIGDNTNKFSGVFDGQMYKIYDLYINRDSYSEIGLFGRTNGAILKNIALRHSNITGYYNVGSLAGRADNSNISRCSVVGGYVNVGNSGYYAGGFVGNLQASFINESFSTGAIYGEWAGGFVGYSDVWVAEIHNSYSSMSVTTTYYGQLMGAFAESYYGLVYDSYVRGNVSCPSNSIFCRGFIGHHQGFGNATDCFFDRNTTGRDDPQRGTPKSTAEMWNQSTYTNWDFNNTWGMDTPYYPYLRNNIECNNDSECYGTNETCYNHICGVELPSHAITLQSILANLSYSAQCSPLTPMENNVVNFTVVYNVHSSEDISETNVVLLLGDHQGASCVSSGNYSDWIYTCVVPFQYYYTSGSYDVIFNFSATYGNESANASLQNGSCIYNELMAESKDRASLTFSENYVGVSNISVDVPMTIKNLGNKNITIAKLMAYDIPGAIVPSKKLLASYFRAGMYLNSSVQLEHGIEKDIPFVLLPGSNATIGFWIWLSTPADVYPQTYIALTPWKLVLE